MDDEAKLASCHVGNREEKYTWAYLHEVRVFLVPQDDDAMDICLYLYTFRIGRCISVPLRQPTLTLFVLQQKESNHVSPSIALVPANLRLEVDSAAEF